MERLGIICGEELSSLELISNIIYSKLGVEVISLNNNHNYDFSPLDFEGNKITARPYEENQSALIEELYSLTSVPYRIVPEKGIVEFANLILSRNVGQIQEPSPELPNFEVTPASRNVGRVSKSKKKQVIYPEYKSKKGHNKIYDKRNLINNYKHSR